MSRGPRALASCLAKTTTPLFRRRGFADGAIVSEWPSIVGPQLAAVTAPERIVFPPRRRDGGTLRLRVAAGGIALELQHLQPQLIERINAYFGFAAVAQLRFLHGPVPRRPQRRGVHRRPLNPAEERVVAAAVAGIDDATVAESLENLGRSVLGRSTPTGAAAGEDR